MQDDTQNTGLPTRAIHDAYLNLQQAHRQFRQARDHDQDITGPQGVFQDAVLTFYELVRPHLKSESALSSYWEGDLPDYAGWDPNSVDDAVRTVREKGTGVYQVQQHVDTVELQQEALTDGGVSSFDDWHQLLGLSNRERLVGVQHGEDDLVYVQLLRIAVLPLRELDHWQVRISKERTQGDGFMAGETTVKTKREFEPPTKLITAKRLLVEAADKLGALSEFDASSSLTEITREDIQKVEEWHQNQVEN